MSFQKIQTRSLNLLLLVWLCSLTFFFLARPVESSESYGYPTPTVVDKVVCECKEQIDWREKNAVNPVQNHNESSCGQNGEFISAVFAGTAAVEAAYQINSGKLVKLSEDEIIDCYSECESATLSDPIRYAQDYGIHYKSDYDQSESPNKCASKDGWVEGKVVKINSYDGVDSNDGALLAALQKQPIGLGIVPANLDDFKSYKSGIYNGNCSHDYYINNELVQYVLLVGYGATLDTSTTLDGKTCKTCVNYWIVKNSRGTCWGENGYMRIKKGGNCIVNQRALFPILDGVELDDPFRD